MFVHCLCSFIRFFFLFFRFFLISRVHDDLSSSSATWHWHCVNKATWERRLQLFLFVFLHFQGGARETDEGMRIQDEVEKRLRKFSENWNEWKTTWCGRERERKEKSWSDKRNILMYSNIHNCCKMLQGCFGFALAKATKNNENFQLGSSVKRGSSLFGIQ